jgi:hypothetical protein
MTFETLKISNHASWTIFDIRKYSRRKEKQKKQVIIRMNVVTKKVWIRDGKIYFTAWGLPNAKSVDYFRHRAYTHDVRCDAPDRPD